MQTLIINGSPRKNGGTATLISALKELLHGNIDVIDTYHAGISPCIDCRHCWTKPGCAIDDGMQKAYGLIDHADNIVIASPIYFGELTGPLLSWASRLQYFWVSKKIRKEKVISDKLRKGGVLLVDGGEGYMEAALAMAKRLLRLMGAEYKDLVYFSGTDYTGPTLPTDYKAITDSIRRLADKLNSDKATELTKTHMES